MKPQKLLLLFLVLLFSEVILAEEVSGVAISETHFCLLDQGKLRCFDPKGEIPAPFQFVYPFAIYGGGNNQCVHDYNGVHCWNWEERALKTYSEFSGVEDFQVSKGYVCGKKRKGAWGCLLAPKSPLQVLPLIPYNSDGEPAQRFIVLDNWICIATLQGKTSIECYHPDRPFNEPLKTNWKYVATGSTGRKDTFALYSNVDNGVVAAGVWTLPESATQNEVKAKGVAWYKGIRVRYDTYLDNFDPLALVNDKKIFLIRNNELFTVGRRGYVAGTDYKYRYEQGELVEKIPFHKTATKFVAAILNLRTDPQEAIEVRRDDFARFQEGEVSSDYFPLYMNDHFLCFSVETSKNHEWVTDLYCGEPGEGEIHPRNLTSFKLTMTPKFSHSFYAKLPFEKWAEYVNYENWKDYEERLDNLPAEKAAFVKPLSELLWNKPPSKQLLFREVIQPLLESTSSPYFTQVAWQEGMKLGSFRQQLQLPGPLDSETIAFLEFSKSKLGTEEEIKRDAWRKLVLQRINRYLSEGTKP